MCVCVYSLTPVSPPKALKTTFQVFLEAARACEGFGVLRFEPEARSPESPRANVRC